MASANLGTLGLDLVEFCLFSNFDLNRRFSPPEKSGTASHSKTTTVYLSFSRRR